MRRRSTRRVVDHETSDHALLDRPDNAGLSITGPTDAAISAQAAPDRDRWVRRVISPSSFGFVADLVRRETAMLCEPGKEYLVEARLLPLAREAGCRRRRRYVDRCAPTRPSAPRRLDALTINETSWFRDNAPYQAFTEVMLPRLLEARRATPAPRRSGRRPAPAARRRTASRCCSTSTCPPAGPRRSTATDVSPRCSSGSRRPLQPGGDEPRDARQPRSCKYFSRVGQRVGGRRRAAQR